MKYTFTVFTPTFNRAHLLYRVYESLKKQTFNDFEWLIIDDGSTDDTQNIVKEWQSKSDFPIRYIWQENGHKKKAFNHGVREAQGELFLTWDSDDEAIPEALEIFYKYWTEIPQDWRINFVGVTALCMDDKGMLVGDRFPSNIFDSDSLESHYRYHIKGEKWGFSCTNILKEYLFPENIHGLVPESVVWAIIAKKYKTRYINEVLRIYYIDSTDSIIYLGKKKSEIEKNAEGMVLNLVIVLENSFQFFLYNSLRFIISATYYTRFKLHIKNKDNKKKYKVNGVLQNLLIIITKLLGFCMYLFDKLR